MPKGKKVIDTIIIILLINFIVLTITYIHLIQEEPKIYAMIPPQVSNVSVVDEKIEKPRKGFVIVDEDGDTAFVPYYVEGVIV